MGLIIFIDKSQNICYNNARKGDIFIWECTIILEVQEIK